MLKKFLSVLLAVMMIVSAMAVGVVTANAATTAGFTPDPKKFYFDVDGTGWTMGAKDKIAFYMAGGDFDTETNATKPLDWGAKKLQGTATAGETGIFEIDPAAKGYTFTPGVQYKIIFAQVVSNSWKYQTCSLFFTADCLGHVAYSDGTEMENDVDSTKTSKTVYWRDMDPEVNGPTLCITSIGNVVGSCVEQGKTKEGLFEEFISEPKDDFAGKTGLENARYYTVEQAKTKTEQKMIDDIGAALGLTKDQVAGAFTSTGAETAWTAEASTLHSHTPADPVQENVTEATCTESGSCEEVVYCSDCGAEISRTPKTLDPLNHDIKLVDEVPATATIAGVQAHYECSRCHTYFTDATGETEANPADYVIAPDKIRGNANGDEMFDSVDCTTIQKVLVQLPVEVYDAEAADADADGIVDILDVSLMQRVLASLTTFEAWDAKHKNA